MSVTAWPEPIVDCVLIGVDDGRAPKAARDMFRRVRNARYCMTYAFGTSMQGKECAPGPLVETVVLRGVKRDRAFVATWWAEGATTCAPCGKALKPTTVGAFRKHPVGGKGSDECPGSGQEAAQADAVPGVSSWAFKSAYVSEAAGWWATGAPKRITSAELSALLTE